MQIKILLNQCFTGLFPHFHDVIPWYDLCVSLLGSESELVFFSRDPAHSMKEFSQFLPVRLLSLTDDTLLLAQICSRLQFIKRNQCLCTELRFSWNNKLSDLRFRPLVYLEPTRDSESRELGRGVVFLSSVAVRSHCMRLEAINLKRPSRPAVVNHLLWPLKEFLLQFLFSLSLIIFSASYFFLCCSCCLAWLLSHIANPHRIKLPHDFLFLKYHG